MSKNQEIELLAEKYLSGALTNEEARRLDSLVNENKASARRLAELMVLHGEMADQLGGEDGIEKEVVPMQPGQESFGYRYAMVAAIAAALVLLWAFLAKSGPGDILVSPEVIATVEASDYAVWGECTVPTARDSQLSAGRLELKEGLVTLRFVSGAQVILDGPVELELLTAMSVKLEEGLLVSDIPESAHGFTILTPGAQVIDHGTTFLTKVSNGGETTVMDVLEGEVELVDARTKENRHFFGGEGAALSLERDGFVVRSHQGGEVLLSEGASTDSQHGRLVSISTADKGGKDGTAVKGDSDFHYDPSLVMVKNKKDMFARKGYLGFDCSELDLEEAKSVELVMNFVYSGYGAAALSKTSRFSVWGVKEDQLDDWKQGRMPWKTGPANVNEADSLNPNLAVRLCEFTIPRGRHEAEYRVGSDDLLSFIESDTNRFITLVVICEDFHASNDLVYSVVGRLHPSGKAPSLDFRY